MFRWDDAKVLLALARAGTLSGAARELAVDATTVGRRLTALESALGERLFDRTPDGVTSTALAESLLPHAESMEQAANALSGGLAGFERGVRGVVRISAPPGLADLAIAPRLAELHARHPELRVELDARVGYVDLSRREADVALRTSRPSRGDLVSVRVTHAAALPLASLERVDTWGNVGRPSDLPWITYGPELDHIPDARFVLSVAPPESLVLRTSSFSSQVAAAEAGLGVFVAPWELVRDRGTLAKVRFTRSGKRTLPAAPEGSLYLVVHRSMRDVPRVAAVWDFIAAQFD